MTAKSKKGIPIMDQSLIELRTPYLIFLGDTTELGLAKTGTGVFHWRRDICVGQLRLEGCEVDLGIEDMTPQHAVQNHGAGTLLIGVANIGGFLPSHWIDTLCAALEAGLDIASGLHAKLADVEILAKTADRHGCKIFDVRHPTQSFPVGNGAKRSGKRLLTVGTDCAVGKMYTTLAIANDMKARGIDVDFRATGQTGIFIAGTGVSVDAVLADFISGAAETICPANNDEHWDIIEGQGSLFHPGYAGVSLGLLHGSQPDALVVCHEASRSQIAFMDGYKLPDIEAVIKQNIQSARLTNPHAQVFGISVNTSKLEADEVQGYLDALSQKLALPACDPVRTGVAVIVDNILKYSTNA